LVATKNIKDGQGIPLSKRQTGEVQDFPDNPSPVLILGCSFASCN
jgi:hypothetical protein